jgi:hypothetical protein
MFREIIESSYVFSFFVIAPMIIERVYPWIIFCILGVASYQVTIPSIGSIDTHFIPPENVPALKALPAISYKPHFVQITQS